MDTNVFPQVQAGEWIWKKNFLSSTDRYMFAHKTVVLDTIATKADLWISAHSVYQLYINGQLISFGPSNYGKNISYADLYDVSCFLQPGFNAISVIVYHYTHPEEYDNKPCGLWLQLEVDDTIKLCSDKSWWVREGTCHQNNRARCTPDSYFCESIDMRLHPIGWLEELNESMLLADPEWENPTLTTPTTIFGASLEKSPYSPNLCQENGEFEAIFHGVIKAHDAHIFCATGQESFDVPGVYAACTYVHMDVASQIPANFICDDRFRFYCNHDIVASTIEMEEDRCLLNEVLLPMRKGWNCLQVIQDVRENSMGFAITFPNTATDKLNIFSEPDDKSSQCWLIAGPLKMPLADATSSIDFDKLDCDYFTPSLNKITDPFSWLTSCRFEKTDAAMPDELGTGEFIMLKLDQLRFGFPKISLNGEDGDIVDITIGNRLNENGLPVINDCSRSTLTLVLRSGNNDYTKYIPCACTYLQISIRSAQGKVKISRCSFNEMVRQQNYETQFSCSDDTLNSIWEVGREVMRRGVNQMNWMIHCKSDSIYMLDAYGLASNMIYTFGDYHFSESLIRQFARAQFENGNIPALGAIGDSHTQINHMSFFPLWLTYHYRTSGDEQLLHEMLPVLELAEQFFASLVDDELGMIIDVDKKFKKIIGEINDNVENLSNCSTDVNALYCRFLLSAAEIYKITNHPERAKRCMRMANSVIRMLEACCWIPSEKVFADSYSANNQEISCNSFTNMLTLFSGIKSPNEYLDYLDYFFFNDPPSSGYPEQTKSRYFNFLFTHTMFALCQKDWTLHYIRDYWGALIDYDAKAWRESADDPNLAGITMSHGNMICPNIFLVREAAGIRSAEPGFTVVYFNPPLDFLTWANLSLQTSNGKILVKWQLAEDGSLDVTINSNFPVKVLPELSSEQMEKTTFRISENIVLLDPEKGED
ncbi:MAG: alpha-L-rhamnosidase N-terminal domain-containing protein [Victivallaceae bacterium]|nr:alpha-L-rhamnosidase N-terminal domain-containing protein [Victivallaceae bacterium]